MSTDTLPGRLYTPDIDGRARRVRSNTLPETAHYTDDGCEVAPRCLRCPLAVCRHDTGLATQRIARRDAEIERLHDEGASADFLAWRFRVHRRTIFRVLAKERAA